MNLIEILKIYCGVYSTLPSSHKRKYLFVLALSFISGLLESLIVVFVPIFIEYIQSSVNTNSQSITNSIITYCVFLIALALISTLFKLFTLSYTLNATASVSDIISFSIYKNVISNPFDPSSRNHKASDSIDLIQRSLRSFTLGNRSFALIISNTAIVITLVIATVIATGAIILPLYTVFALFYILISRKVNKKLSYNSESILKLNKKLASLIQEVVSGLKEIYFYRMTTDYKSKYMGTDKKIRQITNSSEFYVASPKIVIDGAVILLIILISVWMLSLGKINILGSLATLGFSSLKIIPLLSSIFASWSKAVLFSKDADYVSQIYKKYHTQHIKNSTINQNIKFDCIDEYSVKNISFAVSDLIKVENMSLTLSRRDRLLIQSPSGTGKTSLLHTLMGFSKLTTQNNGSIFVNRTSVNYASLTHTLRSSNAVYLGQIPFLFKGNLISNITFESSSTGSALDKLIDVLGLSHLLEYNCLYSEQSKLSGGEKQRVAIARCLYFQPSMLFLDEPTSALDKDNTELFMNLITTNIYLKYTPLVIMVSHDENLNHYFNRILDVRSFISSETT